MAEKVTAAKTSDSTKGVTSMPSAKVDAAAPFSSPFDQVVSLQQTFGNQTVQRLFKSGRLQAALKIGQPNDIYEQEADRVADQVMRMEAPSLSRKCDNCSKEEELNIRRKSESAVSDSSVPDNFVSSLGGGQSLDHATRNYFEPRFGADFSQVRIHAGQRAAESASSINALAYTLGNNVVFGVGQYKPNTIQGKRLLAHELTHVVQQGRDFRRPSALTDHPGVRSSEREAEQVPNTIHYGANVVDIRMHADPTVQRVPGSPAGGCGVCYGTPKNVGIAAHAEISAAFRTQNPTIIAPFPLAPSPTDDNGVLDLAVLRGPNSIDIGEIKPANPAGLLQGDLDLFWYEAQLKKLGFNVGRLMLPPPLAAIPFPTLAPPPCPQFQELFVDPPAHGIYTYWCMPDFSQLIGQCPCKKKPPPLPPVPVKEKEKVEEKEKKRVDEKEKERIRIPVPEPEVVALLAALAALSFLASKLKGAAKGRVLAYATAIAAIVLIASGAEASVGLEGDDPLEALLKLAEAKGQTVPEDIKEAMRNDPKLRELLSKAVKTGDFSEAQREAGERLTRMVATHRSEFTEEELEILFRATEGAKGSIPNGDLTVEELKQAIEAKRKGAGGEPTPGATKGAASGGEGVTKGSGTKAEQPGEAGTPTPSTAPKTPEERLVEGMASKEADGPKFTAALKEKLLAAARAIAPPLTDNEVAELLTRLGSAAGKSEEEIVESVRKGVTALRTKGGEAGPSAPGSEEAGKKPGGTPGKVATDEAVTKAKQGKKDPKTEAVLEEKLGWIEAGQTYIGGPGNIIFQDGKPFSGSIMGRDKTGALFFGKVPVTPRLIGGAWHLEVPAGIKLMGAAGFYGTTQKLSIPAYPGVGTGKKAKETD